MRLTERRQNVMVMTVSSLRKHLDGLSDGACRFSIGNVRGDRVDVCAEYTLSGKRKHAHVALPAYPTGSPDDGPTSNLNVVMDPLEIKGAQHPSERQVFAPLLGEEILAYYDKLHPHAAMPISRCC